MIDSESTRCWGIPREIQMKFPSRNVNLLAPVMRSDCCFPFGIKIEDVYLLGGGGVKVASTCRWKRTNVFRWYWYIFLSRELKQPRRRRQQKPHKFAYLTMKNRIFARFARAFFIFWHFEDVLVLSTTWNDLFCSCVDDVSIWSQMFNFVLLCPKRWFQFNSRIVRIHFSIIMTLNNWKMIAETRSYIFRWRSRFRQRRVFLSSLIILTGSQKIYRNLRKANKCLSNVLSLIPYMTRKISAILHVFNSYIFRITEKKQFSLRHHLFLQ